MANKQKDKRRENLDALTKRKSAPVAVAPVAPAPPVTDAAQPGDSTQRRRPPPQLRKDGKSYREIRVRATSVALTNEEFDIIEDVALSVGASSGNVLSWAARYFLREYAAGRISLRMGPPQFGKRRMLELPTGYEIPADAGDA